MQNKDLKFQKDVTTMQEALNQQCQNMALLSYFLLCLK
jgi:hypothetical protein